MPRTTAFSTGFPPPATARAPATIGPLAIAVSALLGLAACHPAASADAPPPETPGQCTERLRAFGEAVARLPERSVASAARADLPVSTLGAQPGPGPVLEVSDREATVDGTRLEGATAADRAARLGDWASRTFGLDAPPAKGAGRRAAIYVATSSDTDVQTLREYFGRIPTSVDLRLLVRTPKPSSTSTRAASPAEDDAATRLLLEPDPAPSASSQRPFFATNVVAPACRFDPCKSSCGSSSNSTPSSPARSSGTLSSSVTSSRTTG